MATTTPRLGLPRPESTDNFNLANHNAFVDAVDTNAAKQADVGDKSTLRTTDKSNLVNAVNELFQNVSDGKITVADAIADMNQLANGSMTFDELATAIRAISSDATAGPGDVLSGKTFYQGGSKQTGTMPIHNGLEDIAGWTNGDSNTQVYVPVPAGYWTGGAGVGVQIQDTDLIPGNIKAGANIFNVQGNFTADATATDPDVKSGKTYYRQGAKYTGSMPVNTGWRIVPWSNSNGDSAVDVQYSAGYWDANIMGIQDANLIPDNIRGSIFGVSGTAKRYAEGSNTPSTGGNITFSVSGLRFQPRLIILVMWYNGSLHSKKSYHPNSNGTNDYQIYPGGSVYVNTVGWGITSSGFSAGLNIPVGTVVYWYACE
jgi:hypothetical protein